MDAATLPTIRPGGLTAARQPAGARDRQRRDASGAPSQGPAPRPEGNGLGLPSFGDLGNLLKRGDIALAIGVMTILVVLILPLPPVLLLSFI